MFTKHLLFTTLLMLGAIISSAQSTTTYFTDKGKQVATATEADYTRVSTKADSASSLYNVIEYYKNGNVKRKGTSTHPIYNMWQGAYAEFYSSGNKRAEGTYTDDKRIGSYSEYYPNGKLHDTKEYADPNKSSNKNAIGGSGDDYLIKTCNDSTGKTLLTDGNGHYIDYHPGFKIIYEQGDVHNGLRTGKWTGGNDDKDSIRFVETYDNGILLKGESRDRYGKTYNYTIREAQPEFEGGEQAFAKFLMGNVVYPARSKKNNVTGRVLISFVIEKDGKLTDIKVTRSPNAELGSEGVRVLKLSPKWKPGIQYGRPVRVQFTVPLNFDLRD